MFGPGIKLIDEEDDFFASMDNNSRSNLSNIFESQQQQSNSEQTLKYSAPTKPNGSTGCKANWNIELAKVVSAFKLVDSENLSQGRIGLALLKSSEGLRKIILYRSKTNVLATITILDDFKIFYKEPYFQFSDDLQFLWNVMFDNDDEQSFLNILSDDIIVRKSYDDDDDDGETLQKDQNNKTIEQIEQSKTESLTICSSEISKKEFSNNLLQPKQNEHTLSADEKVKEGKTNILTRMARMGQALPIINQTTTTDLSDSSDTEFKKRILPSKPSLCSRKPKTQISSSISSGQLSKVISPATALSYSNSSFSFQDSQFINMLLSENRNQNTELRMNLSKLETKIEKVLDQVSIINVTKDVASKIAKYNDDDEVLALEGRILEMKRENKTLKLKINELTDIIAKEKSSGQKLNKEKFKEFENLLILYELDLDNFDNDTVLFVEIIHRCITKENSLREMLQTNESSVADSKKLLEDLEKEKGKDISDLNQQIEHLESKIHDLESLTEVLRKDKEKLLEKTENFDKIVSNTVKDIMNNFYQNLVKKDIPNDILKLCASLIKQETKNAINNNIV